MGILIYSDDELTEHLLSALQDNNLFHEYCLPCPEDNSRSVKAYTPFEVLTRHV